MTPVTKQPTRFLRAMTKVISCILWMLLQVNYYGLPVVIATDNANKYVEDMKFSVPSSPKPVDVNGDGVTDAIYFGDLGGQVFRVDLDNKATSGTSIAKRVRLLAKLGQTESATPANQRRFYEPPAVATI
jgi:Tfp pilus tip-associated adhesin PilY1